MPRIAVLLAVVALVGCGKVDDKPPPADEKSLPGPAPVLPGDQELPESAPLLSDHDPLPVVPAECVRGTFCPRGSDKYILREKWKNTGNRPIRTLDITIDVYNKKGKRIFGAKDYPIYSVSDSEPGVLPGQTYEPGPNEGFIIPFGVGSPNEPGRVEADYTRATEKGIK